MKKKLNKKLLFLQTLWVLILASIFNACTTDNENFDTEVNSSFASYAVPQVGGIYTIQNSASGRTLDIQGGSNSNGANLQVWGTNVNVSATHRQWEVISVEGNYVRLRGIDSGKSIEIAGGSNSNGANAQQWAYQGTTHQQWEIISVGDGLYRIKNRDSGKSLRSAGTTNGTNVDQWAYNGANNQKWFFTEVGGSDEGGGEDDDNDDADDQDDPDDEDDNNTGSGTSSDFINTNDGVFELNDFQIESSSHRSSSTDISTQSWDADDFSLSSEWYDFSGGDYYLSCASGDGKRTEWKEYPGNERSLFVNKVMTYEASVSNLPENGVTIAQVHNRGDNVNRPYLRVYIDSDRKIKIKETTNSLTNSSGTYTTVVGPDYVANERLKVQISIGNGSVNVKVQAEDGNLERNFTPSTTSGYASDFYLKAGVYTEGNDTEPTIRFYSFEKQ